MHETLHDCRSLQFGDLQVSDVSELLVLYYLMRQQKIADTKAALANVTNHVVSHHRGRARRGSDRFLTQHFATNTRRRAHVMGSN